MPTESYLHVIQTFLAVSQFADLTSSMQHTVKCELPIASCSAAQLATCTLDESSKVRFPSFPHHGF